MSGYKCMMERLNSHKSKIENSWMFYRRNAKKQKITVLTAATKYLAAEMNKHEFLKVLESNKSYTNAFFQSKTKCLIEAALNETPNEKITSEGYVTM